MKNTILSLFFAQFLLTGIAGAIGDEKEEINKNFAPITVARTPNAIEIQEEALNQRTNCILRGTEGPLKYIGALSTSGTTFLAALSLVVGDNVKTHLTIATVVLGSLATLCSSMAVYAHQNGNNTRS